MSEAEKLIINFGVSGAIIVLILFLGIKYLPKIIDNALEKSRKKDYREELYLEAIRNNTAVIENTKAVIENNTANSNKLEDYIIDFRSEFREHAAKAEKISSNIEILKDRTKK